MIYKLKGHKGAVKGLSWCPWKSGILATGGGNKDKCLKLWNTTNSQLITSQKI
jgi:WD40 repeat protein